MKKDSLEKGTLIVLSTTAMTGGFKLTEQNVWAGVFLIALGMSLPYIREYRKK